VNDANRMEVETAIAPDSLASRSDRGVFISLSYTFAAQGAAPLVKKLAFPNTE